MSIRHKIMISEYLKNLAANPDSAATASTGSDSAATAASPGSVSATTAASPGSVPATTAASPDSVPAPGSSASAARIRSESSTAACLSPAVNSGTGPIRRNYPLSQTYSYPSIARGWKKPRPLPFEPYLAPIEIPSNATVSSGTTSTGRMGYLHTGRCTERPTREEDKTPCYYLDIHTSTNLAEPGSPSVQSVKENRAYNICGLNDNERGPPNKETKMMLKFICSTGVNHNGKIFEDGIMFNSFIKRKKTFDICNVISPENITALCEAGFYYIGDGNSEETKCFCCGKHVLVWGNSIRPWTLHAIISKDCHYMTLCKGKFYVDKVYNNYQGLQNFIDKAYSKQLIGIRHDEDSFNEIVTTPNYSDSEDESSFKPQLCKKIRGKPLTERLYPLQIHNKIPESLLCKFCFKEMINVLIIPCGHINSCIQCSLTVKHCSTCAQLYNDNTYLLRVFIEIIDENTKIKKFDYWNFKTMCFTEKSEINPNLCKICQKNTMVAYVPCRHMYSCGKCALSLGQCPVCSGDLLGIIQTSLM